MIATEEMTRRSFLGWMGASLALAGLSGCTRMPAEKIFPYLLDPEEGKPGDPLYFATTLTLGGFGRGALVKSYEGRPTKIEGNPLHPASLGSSDVFMQGDLLGLYDPERLQSVMHLGVPSSWNDLQAELARAAWKASGGEGLRILTETVSSPSLGAALDRFLSHDPQARWHSYAPVHRDRARAAALSAFGEDARPLYHFDRAEFVLSLDGDFLDSGPAQVPYSRAFMSSRRGDGSSKTPCELWVVESTVSLTGSMADRRWAVRPSELEKIALSLLTRAGVEGVPSAADLPVPELVQAALEKLKHHVGRSLVVTSERAPAALQVIAFVLNHSFGNFGNTMEMIPPAEFRSMDQTASLRDLTHDLRDGKVKTLLILGGNPVYSAPADLEFTAALEECPLVIHQTLHLDETSERSHWVVPAAHELESWGDARAWDGTVGLQQPLIAPLYDGKTAGEVLSFLTGNLRSARDLLGEYWKKDRNWDESRFETAIQEGMIADSGFSERPVRLRQKWRDVIHSHRVNPASGLELRIDPDRTIWDGRWSNNGWLQELPKPLTELTWDNAVLISEKTAAQYGLSSGDEVLLEHARGRLRGPVWIQTGHPDGTVSVQMGYGRTRAGSVGNGRGFSVFPLRLSDSDDFLTGIRLTKTGEKRELACTQVQMDTAGRDPVRQGTFQQPPKGDLGRRESLLPEFVTPDGKPSENAWGMSIDLTACIGCKACVIACQAENNIPVVGKDEVLKHRFMHWIRVDRYIQAGSGRTLFQPVPCMHCETAPCEVVCPTAATNHSSDGLNQMVYNRCVGTRYCSNNCPYKVRRFNFFQYSDTKTSTYRKMRNPEVTVRSRGVMEKCTYCIQRIQSVRIGAERDERPIRDGELQTACQQVCPTEAIIFGDLNDPKSRVRRLRSNAHTYSLLGELGTRPRTTYLPRLNVGEI